jgi:hypothetical protein
VRSLSTGARLLGRERPGLPRRLRQPQNDRTKALAGVAELAELVCVLPIEPDPNESVRARRRLAIRPRQHPPDGSVRCRGDWDRDHGCKRADGDAVPERRALRQKS